MLRLRILKNPYPALYASPESATDYEKCLLAGLEDPGGFQNAICGHDFLFMVGAYLPPCRLPMAGAHREQAGDVLAGSLSLTSIPRISSRLCIRGLAMASHLHGYRYSLNASSYTGFCF